LLSELSVQSIFPIWVRKQISMSQAAQYDRQTKWS